jgi:hypothetical protein
MPELYSVALEEAREAERDVNRIAAAIERGKQSASLAEMLRRRDPLIQAFAHASQQFLDSMRRMEEVWADSAEGWSRVTFL